LSISTNLGPLSRDSEYLSSTQHEKMESMRRMRTLYCHRTLSCEWCCPSSWIQSRQLQFYSRCRFSVPTARQQNCLADNMSTLQLILYLTESLYAETNLRAPSCHGKRKTVNWSERRHVDESMRSTLVDRQHAAGACLPRQLCDRRPGSRQ
jgi:hypothetical protein